MAFSVFARRSKALNGSGRRLPAASGQRCHINWEEEEDQPSLGLLCADAPPHARITVGNQRLAAAQHPQSASERHHGWTTEGPQTDSLVDIDVNDFCLTSTALDNPVSHQLLFFFLDTDFRVGSCPKEFRKRIIFVHVATSVLILISPLGIGALFWWTWTFFKDTHIKL